ncbi:SAM-dependent methyltransferase [Clostridium sp. D2Q-14]|uniref:TrmO family methyltransferase domain-containing protein n=1 Tax=Anaeromonas gelatinilytica TaxID=2683194 RepID=UPI00193B99DB|nr:TrmO family methyltransferase [Anaeromonas gelatinilytica]MBS4536545.1 SAM-dependent methyltransferase [Anaeromonas gelatinilytica]
MKKIEFEFIGDHKIISKVSEEREDIIKINFKKGLEKAMIKLDDFSHCLVFTKDSDELFCYGTKMHMVDEKNGQILIEKNNIKGEIIDIKPYFPCEENIKDIFKKQEAILIPFNGDSIGEYLFINNVGVIQFHESEFLTSKKIESELEKIKAGDYIRVLWWFHRFDKKEFRKNYMCKPPYENAPRCGVFATRSPVRPNPIASTVVKVEFVDKYNHFLKICGFDGFENSRILQIMSYNVVDTFNDVKVPKWVEHWTDYKVFKESKGNIESNYSESENIMDEEKIYIQELEPKDELELEKMNVNEILVENASIHNLKNVSVKIPKEKIIVFTGVSGSGKSSLAFDTIYRESQKQFIDLFFSNLPIDNNINDSNVEKITGLQPAIAIDQKNLGMNPRSTVGSVSGTADYLKLLYATIGKRICPNCHEFVPDNNVCSKCGTIYFQLTPSLFSYNNPDYMCPVCKGLGEEMQIDVNLIVSNPQKSILDGASVWWGKLRKYRENPNANWMKGEVLALADDMKEDLEVPFKELSAKFKEQLFYGTGNRKVSLNYENSNGRKGTITRPVEGVVNTIHRLLKDNNADKSIKHLERFIVKRKCSRCNGERLMEEGRLVQIGMTRYPEVASMNITNLSDWCHRIYNSLSDDERKKSKAIFMKLLYRLRKIEQVGLGYLSLDRSIPSLSGGEAQRLKLAIQFGSGLTNILYIMDEPSKGLHPRDYSFLMKSIKDLKKLKNTVIMVEHKKEFIDMADYIVEIGPRAGKYGGELIRAEEVNIDQKLSKLTEQKKGTDKFNFKPKSKIINMDRKLTLKGATTNNLKNIDITIPLSKLICVIGVSGSGKSSLVSKTLYPSISKALGKSIDTTGDYEEIIGIENLKEVYYVSQNAIGRTPRSNPGTYSGVFDLIRDFYANLDDSKNKKLTKEHFSFNSKKGQCPKCKGTGHIVVPMHFMSDIYTTCSKCNGERYRDKVLEVKYKGYTISDLLKLEINDVKEIFKEEKKIFSILDMLDKVGVSYIKLGQNATTLSGGEAQRIKLAKELCLGKTKDVLYILDEPTIGLHDEDVKNLIHVLKELTNKGATVIVIEHNPFLIQKAEWIIEMGPEGGDLGGYIINEGWLI